MCIKTHKEQRRKTAGGGGIVGTATESTSTKQQQKYTHYFACQAMPTSQYNTQRWKPWFIAAWSLHFIITILAIAYGTLYNDGDRKYTPVDIDLIEDDCSKAFVDVFADSMEHTGSFVCCNDFPRQPHDDSALCRIPPNYLMFAKRLAKFPEAWLLPLFPFLIRGALHLLRLFQGLVDQSTRDPTVFRRLYLYLGVIQIRGWILYLAFNAIEGLLVGSPQDNCWYQNMLPAGQETCQGRVADFSDHIVLYFAQILPIPLMEVLHSFVVPFWESTYSWDGPLVGAENSKSRVIPTLLLTGLAHLYCITLLGAYKTSAFFHTAPEIVSGYIISLLVQVPLLLLQCTDLWPKWRQYFFGYISC